MEQRVSCRSHRRRAADLRGVNSDHGGVDDCDCAEILALIEVGKIDTTPLITHHFKLEDIEEAYHLFENKLDGVIKVAVTPN